LNAVANSAANAEKIPAQPANNPISFNTIAEINVTEESEEYKQGPDGVRFYGCAAMPI
jgi:hypothetical protein